jgi:hypothetical protein
MCSLLRVVRRIQHVQLRHLRRARECDGGNYKYCASKPRRFSVTQRASIRTAVKLDDSSFVHGQLGQQTICPPKALWQAHAPQVIVVQLAQR